MHASKHLRERKARAGRRLGRKGGANFEPLRGPIRTERYALLQRAIRQHGPHLGILAFECDIDFQLTAGPLEAARQHDGARHGLRETHAQLHADALVRNRWREATRNGARAMAKHRLARSTDPRLRVRGQFEIGHARRQHRAPRAAVRSVNVGHPTRQELHIDRAIADAELLRLIAPLAVDGAQRDLAWLHHRLDIHGTEPKDLATVDRATVTKHAGCHLRPTVSGRKQQGHSRGIGIWRHLPQIVGHQRDPLRPSLLRNRERRLRAPHQFAFQLNAVLAIWQPDRIEQPSPLIAVNDDRRILGFAVGHELHVSTPGPELPRSEADCDEQHCHTRSNLAAVAHHARYGIGPLRAHDAIAGCCAQVRSEVRSSRVASLRPRIEA